MLLAMVAHNHV